MRTIIGVSILAALLGAGYAARADGPGPGGPGACNGAGPRGHGPRHYDPKTVATVSGEVAAVQQGAGRRGGGARFDLTTADGTVAVHAGPAWFLRDQGIEIAQGDKVEVTGSRATLRGQPALIAQVVKKGDKAVVLRDMTGIPVWSRCGER
jgi:hypothetical protein